MSVNEWVISDYESQKRSVHEIMKAPEVHASVMSTACAYTHVHITRWVWSLLTTMHGVPELASWLCGVYV